MHTHWVLSHARGYLSLGLIREAADEIALLTAEERESTEALALRRDVAFGLGDWPEMRHVARCLRARLPDSVQPWVDEAYALRRCESLMAAADCLREALQRFLQEPIIPYNLACYVTQMGRLDEGRILLQAACILDPEYLQLARKDPDLAPLDLG